MFGYFVGKQDDTNSTHELANATIIRFGDLWQAPFADRCHIVHQRSRIVWYFWQFSKVKAGDVPLVIPSAEPIDTADRRHGTRLIVIALELKPIQCESRGGGVYFKLTI